MDTQYIIVQLVSSIILLLFSLMVKLQKDIKTMLLILSVLNLSLVILNKEYYYLKLFISSTIIITGSIQLGEYFIENDQMLEISYFTYGLVILLGLILDIFHIHIKLGKKWLFPVRMIEERFLFIMGLYFLNLVLICVYYFNLKYTFIDHTLFAFILSLSVIKILLLLYGRFTKTEVIDNEITWCCKKIQYERVNFDRLDEETTTELYIGTALNSPIIKETLDTLLLFSTGFFYGTNKTNSEIFLMLSLFIVSTIVLAKNKV
jgi:hypothetical protein